MLTHSWEGYHVYKLPPAPFMRVTMDRKMIVPPQYYMISSITLASKKIMYNRILQEGAMQTRLLPEDLTKQCANPEGESIIFAKPGGNNHLCKAAECCIGFIICLSITLKRFLKWILFLLFDWYIWNNLLFYKYVP